MGIVQDLLAQQQKLAQDRVPYEKAWADCARLALPFASERYDFSGGSTASSLTGTAQRPRAEERSREIYDSTAVWACERLMAGMESLITPRAQKWHSFAIDEAFVTDASDVENEWLDELRDYVFAARYDPRSNFAIANQKHIRGNTVFGTGIMYSEENMGRKGIDPVKVPFFYRQIPVVEAYMSIDPYDDVDTMHRITSMSARSAADYFGFDKLSKTLQQHVNSNTSREDTFTFMHSVMPRDQADGFKGKRAGQRYASFWIEVETSHLISNAGFYTFPYSVSWWDQVENSAYGQSALMAILADVKMLQAMSKTALQAAQQMVKPPLATMAGLYNSRLNLNPGAINPGYIDDAGRLKAQPIVTAQNPSFAENLMELKRSGIRESLYVNLFQILVQNPQQTATEALIRANEKGEMLGPAGSKIESGIARAADREIDIVQRKGAFQPGSPLQPPASIAGKNIGVKFTGPLARLRRMQEMQGVQTVLGMAGTLAQYDQGVLDRIDGDETLELTREIGGAPRKMFRTDDETAAFRQQRAQMQENLAASQVTEQLATAAGRATPAIQAAMQANAA